VDQFLVLFELALGNVDVALPTDDEGLDGLRKDAHEFELLPVGGQGEFYFVPFLYLVGKVEVEVEQGLHVCLYMAAQETVYLEEHLGEGEADVLGLAGLYTVEELLVDLVVLVDDPLHAVLLGVLDGDLLDFFVQVQTLLQGLVDAVVLGFDVAVAVVAHTRIHFVVVTSLVGDGAI